MRNRNSVNINQMITIVFIGNSYKLLLLHKLKMTFFMELAHFSFSFFVLNEGNVLFIILEAIFRF